MPLFTPTSPVLERQSLGRLINQGTVLLMVFIGSVILILALMILFHQNANATKGYTLRTLERERSGLLLEEEVLKMQVAKAQALERLERENQIQTMLPVKHVMYTEGDTTVATKGQ